MPGRFQCPRGVQALFHQVSPICPRGLKGQAPGNVCEPTACPQQPRQERLEYEIREVNEPVEHLLPLEGGIRPCHPYIDLGLYRRPPHGRQPSEDLLPGGTSKPVFHDLSKIVGPDAESRPIIDQDLLEVAIWLLRDGPEPLKQMTGHHRNRADEFFVERGETIYDHAAAGGGEPGGVGTHPERGELQRAGRTCKSTFRVIQEFVADRAEGILDERWVRRAEGDEGMAEELVLKRVGLGILRDGGQDLRGQFGIQWVVLFDLDRIQCARHLTRTLGEEQRLLERRGASSSPCRPRRRPDCRTGLYPLR